ncbi:MAG: ribbon-helix-helix domain-containing protein [Thermoanaerobaculia bacterium]|nr:ribbon-helix-helix domain-containing protein [Thermoanaerobaculia bacterium]
MARRPGSPRYPRLDAALPPHLVARLQAAASVLRVPVARLVEQAVETRIAELGDDQRELIDRLAAETVTRTERE